MSDMWLPAGEDPRDKPDQPRGERAVVVEYLERYRTTLELKCSGLTAEQLARRSVPPSTLSLLGLLRHLAKVEHSWNVRVLQDHMDLPQHFRSAAGSTAGSTVDRDEDFNAVVADDAMVAEAWSLWRSEVEAARAWLETDSFERLVTMSDGDQIEVRDIVVHLIEEYARHCGHADLLRECIDGRTGQ